MQEGEIAAETLLGLLSTGRGTKPPKTRESRKFEIIERETTSVGTPSKHLANKAMAFIRRNYKAGIGVEDVLLSIPGRSRRLLDMRFREMYGCTPHEAILRTRYAELKRRLVRSKAPIGELMEACGFSDLSNAKRAFKSRFGMPMREWRNMQGHRSPSGEARDGL